MQSLKFIYSEKATKFCEIFSLLLSYVVPVKSKLEILQNFVAFSEYMNFTTTILQNSDCNPPSPFPDNRYFYAKDQLTIKSIRQKLPHFQNLLMYAILH